MTFVYPFMAHDLVIVEEFFMVVLPAYDATMILQMPFVF